MARWDLNEQQRYNEYLNSREWGLLKRAVRQRAGGICERCHLAPIYVVHHLTYDRKYHERLEDLQGLCTLCNLYVHGEGDEDPLKIEPVYRDRAVYLAGPITNNLWRDELLIRGNIEDASENGPTNALYDSLDGENWFVAENAVLGGFDFAGPYFLDIYGGHGAELAPSTHGAGWNQDAWNHSMDEEDARRAVVEKCLQAIRWSDIVFAWLPAGTDASGTLFELGYAQALGRYILICTDTERDGDSWFACMAATALAPIPNRFYGDTPREAWEKWVSALDTGMKLPPKVREEFYE